MLLLSGPYGLNDIGVWIKLIVVDGTKFDKSRLICVLMDYSCHIPAMNKIYSCLIYSGEYSCILQKHWFEERHMEVTKRLLGLGIKLQVLKVIDHNGKNKDDHKFFKVNELLSTELDPINDFKTVDVPSHYKEMVMLMT